MSQYNINNISPSQRDYLLNLNLAFSRSVANYTQHASGIGYPIQMSTNYSVRENRGLLLIGSEELSQISYNKYQSNTYELKSVAYNPIQHNVVNGGYYSNGQITGIDIKDDEIFSPFGFSVTSSIGIGTALLTKNTNDTQRGTIAIEGVKKMFEYRLAQNVYNKTIGRINTNLYSIIGGDGLFKKDFSITPDTGIGLFDDLISISGYENPFKGISASASPIDAAVETSQMSSKQSLERNNKLIKQTGKAQSKVLKKLLNQNFGLKRNGYAPNYKINGKEFGFNNISTSGDGFNDAYVTYSEGIISRVDTTSTLGKYNSTKPLYMVSNSDATNHPNLTDGVDNQDVPFMLPEGSFSPKISGNPNSIISKTVKLMNNNVIKTPIANKGVLAFENDDLVTLNTTKTKGFKGQAMSKGSQFVYLERVDGKNQTTDVNSYFCRSWVHRNAYDRVESLQKHRGIDTGIGRRMSVESSVLGDNGFVKITPYANNGVSEFKRYMFSLENLAWSNNLLNLPDSEIGSGDPITGTKGRIMWFPPYGLQFSESSSTNLDTHTFIGRGEPMYTYNNTERTGTLNFMVIVDNSAQMNGGVLEKHFLPEDYDSALLSLTAGCGNNNFLDENFSELEKSSIKALEDREAKIMDIANQTPPEPLKFYFPNDVSEFKFPEFETPNDVNEARERYTDKTRPTAFKHEYYEVFGTESKPVDTSWQVTPTGGYTPGKTTNENGNYLDRKNYGLNSWVGDLDFIDDLRRKLVEECPTCKVHISGYASTDGLDTSNDSLSIDRAKYIADFFINDILREDTISKDLRFGSNNETVKGKGETGVENNTDEDHLDKKKSRVVVVTFKPDPTIAKELINQEVNKSMPEVNEYKRQLKYRFYDEANFFEKLKQTDPLAIASIGKKIKYFNPAFHSITPEGFNSRLTFLNQCVRQGSTPTSDSSRPNNMAFGMPPVCILRLGDFFNTKIMIDSLSVDYEQMWDLNPEGIGIQPMIANVSLSFKIIGGASMEGPIAKLQNALSFNYYANTQIFDPRADYLVEKNGEVILTDGISNLAELYNSEEEVTQRETGIDSSFEVTEQISEVNQVESPTEVNITGVEPTISTPSKSVKTLYIEEGSPYYVVEMYDNSSYFIMVDNATQNQINAQQDSVGRMGVLQNVISGNNKSLILSINDYDGAFEYLKTTNSQTSILVESNDISATKDWVNTIVSEYEGRSDWNYLAKIKLTNLKNELS